MDRIEHSGVVKRVDAERVCVEITAHGACGSCKAREACGLGQTGQKIVEIRTPAAATYRPGDCLYDINLSTATTAFQP